LDLRLSAALLAGRAAGTLSRRLGRGGGTVISGHVVPRIAPRALSSISARIRYGVVMVSGTNGKTTTSRLLSRMLTQSGLRPLHNRAGANLLTGLISAVAADADLQGMPRANVGVFEVDEATVPGALQHVKPRALLLTNLFRDQLDRYGEVHYVAGLWREALPRLPGNAQLILNADDPLVASLGDGRSGAVKYFGLGDVSQASTAQPHAADARLCTRCAARLSYTVTFYGHLGHYCCPSCGLERPTPDVEAESVILKGTEGAQLTVRTPAGPIAFSWRMPGLYNAYNALAATAAALSLGIGIDEIRVALESFSAAFGRLERIAVEGRILYLALVKNPVGFTEVLRTIGTAETPSNLLILINDQFADGTDVSWLWDVDFEQLAGRVHYAVCSGTRAEDMAVRLKYAGVDPKRLRVENDPRRALEQALEQTDPGETLYVLPTYTAMLHLRDVLHRAGYVSGFWED
jgi:lipid II isoglutaminyl synthase (glutamine-hydrolysing)